MIYKVSPSELTYLFEDCKYCFSLKIKHNITQPSMPMPGIFSAIAGKQKEFYNNKKTEEFCPSLPSGIVAYGEKWVQSIPIKKFRSAKEFTPVPGIWKGAVNNSRKFWKNGFF